MKKYYKELFKISKDWIEKDFFEFIFYSPLVLIFFLILFLYQIFNLKLNVDNIIT